VTDDLFVPYCDPWPLSGHDDECGPTEAHFPGEPGCSSVGTACPADGFAADLPTDRMVVYVDPSSPRGDGTRASPYSSVNDFAWASLPPNTVVALSAGTHVGYDVEVVGACPSETIVMNSGEAQAAMVAWGATLTVRNLRVSGPATSSGIDAIEGGSLELDGVVLDGLLSGIYLDDTSSLDGRNLILRDMVPGDRWGMQLRGTATLRRVVVERAYNDGIQVREPTADVTLERVAVRETAKLGDMWGSGLTAILGAKLGVRESVLEGNHLAALFVQGAATRVDLSDVVIRRTHELPNGEDGNGIRMGLGATITAERVFMDENHSEGFTSGEGGGTFSATDLVVRGGIGTTEPFPPEEQGRHGRGLDINTGCSATVERVALVDSAENGVMVAGGELTATDLIVRGSRLRGDGTKGRAVNLQTAGSITITRGEIDSNHEVGVFATSNGTSMTLEDVVISETLPDMDLWVGRGINIQDYAAATLTRVRVRTSRGVGILAIAGATVDGREVEVVDTLPRECVATTCPEDPRGSSVVAAINAHVSLEDFQLTHGTLCGAMIASGAEMDLRSGRIANHPLGACIQVEGYDVDRLSQDVRYVDNDSNLETTMLPVPDVLGM
jgi:hypothetical protein